jgi:hypothetical protein
VTTGPFLYDDGPAPLHTGAPRRRGGLLLVLFGATVVVAVLMVLLLPLVTGSPDKQARQVVGVFLQAMAKGDTGTARGLLCDKERARLTEDQIAGAYLGPEPGRVVSATRDTRAGITAELVGVRWADGTASRFTVVPEGGTSICGVSAAG